MNKLLQKQFLVNNFKSTVVFNLVFGLISLIIINKTTSFCLFLSVLLCIFVCFTELYELLIEQEKRILYFIGLLLTTIIYSILSYSFSLVRNIEDYALSIISIISIFLFITFLFAKTLKDVTKKLAFLFFIIFYLGFLSSFLMKIRLLPGGNIDVSYLIVAAWIRDAGAYLFGSHIHGKIIISKIANQKKTVEGAVLGWIFTTIIVCTSNGIFLYLLPTWHRSIIYILCVTLIAGIFGQFGDLFESLLKRTHGQQDFQFKTLPLHQALLDKFDCLLFISPVTYLFLIIINNYFH
jgi:phosphatidate cytidylyltransferase